MLHIHGVEDRYRYPIKNIEVTNIYKPSFLKGADLKVIEKYKKQILRGKYDPIFVCKNFVIDGTHRVIAAYQLDIKYIKSYVCIEENMPKRKKGPRRGDFVLFEDGVWEIVRTTKKVIIISPLTGEEADYEELLIDSLVSSDIKVWDTEGEPIEDQEEY